MIHFKRILMEYLEANRAFFRAQTDKKTIDRVRHEYDMVHLHRKVLEDAAPCFVLSTGRCGTKLLDCLFGLHPGIRSFHESVPELTHHSGEAYRFTEARHAELKTLIDAARYESIRDCYLLGKTYAETNNRITFFAYALADLYSRAKFIHLLRHPVPFVESGLKRNWYSGHHFHDEGRITPSGAEYGLWRGWETYEKIAWLWNETQAFIEAFKKSIPVLTVRAEDLFEDPDTATGIFQFLKLSPLAEKQILKRIRKPVNVQKGKPSLRKDPQKVKRIAELTPLRERYGYGPNADGG